MDLDFLKFIGSPIVAVVAIVAIIILKGEWLFKPIISRLEDKEHKEETREALRSNLCLLLQNAIRHTPFDERYIRDTWQRCEKLGINGGMKRMYEAWEADHTVFLCPIKGRKHEKLTQ